MKGKTVYLLESSCGTYDYFSWKIEGIYAVLSDAEEAKKEFDSTHLKEEILKIMPISERVIDSLYEGYENALNEFTETHPNTKEEDIDYDNLLKQYVEGNGHSWKDFKKSEDLIDIMFWHYHPCKITEFIIK